jgi:hypothetical protein
MLEPACAWAAREAVPIGLGGRAVVGQRGHRPAKFVQAQPDALAGAEEGHAAQHMARVHPSPTRAAATVDQAFGLVEAQRAGRHTRAPRDVADGQPANALAIVSVGHTDEHAIKAAHAAWDLSQRELGGPDPVWRNATARALATLGA